MKLYSYFRSSAAFRVRIALNLKGIDPEVVPVHLGRDGGEQKQPSYLAKNPQGLVPLLELDGNGEGDPNNEQAPDYISQSLAIMEYLDEVYPQPSLLPSEPLARARVRSIAQMIATDIHPLNNLRVLKYLTIEMGLSEEQKNTWYQHWIKLGFEALETTLNQLAIRHQATSKQATQKDQSQAKFCIGSSPTIADCCLVPQVYNAQRFECPMQNYPRIQAINTHCLSLPAFQQALPENQADSMS
jgi:maleylacetoacetate isomerase